MAGRDTGDVDHDGELDLALWLIPPAPVKRFHAAQRERVMSATGERTTWERSVADLRSAAKPKYRAALTLERSTPQLAARNGSHGVGAAPHVVSTASAASTAMWSGST